MPNDPSKNKYKPRKDGLFYCKDYPVNGKHCNFVHQRASSLGRHRRTHMNKPWTYNPRKAKEKVNDHSNSHYQPTPPQANGAGPDPVTIAFLAGQIKAIIDNAASIAEASPTEITHGIVALLQPGSLRKVSRPKKHL